MKVLVVKMSSMGDVLHTLPALTDAGQAIPDIRFDWLVEEGFAEIPAWHPLVDKVIPIAFRRWRKTFFRSLFGNEVRNFFKNLRVEKYDLILDAQGLIKSAVFAWCGHGKRAGLDGSSVWEYLAQFVYQRKCNVNKKQHAITRVRQLFADALHYRLSETIDYGLNAKHLFKPVAESEKPYLVFVHSTSRDDKLWPEDYWIELANLAAEKAYQVKLPWGSAVERQRAERIAAKSSATVLPKLSLRNVGAELAYAKAVVAVDTGLGHLAAALNIPSISLYGPTDPVNIGTMGGNQQHLCSATDSLVNLEPQLVWQQLVKLL